jgi:archaellum component FlaC
VNEIIDGLKVALNTYEFDGEKEKAATMKSKIEQLTQLMETLQENYSRSLAIYESLELKTFDSDYSESMEDTVERLYQQGYSDALLMAIKLLEKGAK